MGFQGISWTKSGIAWLMVGTSLPYIYIYIYIYNKKTNIDLEVVVEPKGVSLFVPSFMKFYYILIKT